MSTLFLRTLREDPADADVDSAKLLQRAGYIRKAAPGIWTWLPLGLSVLNKIEEIIREEINGIGAQEVHFPALLPREPYEATHRWEEYGDNIFRLKDRHESDYLLAPTHEEMFTLLVKDMYSSYKDLPVTLYQIQTKYRDEIRPRFGLLRSREFIMKDAYSFNASQESVQETYDAMGEAYKVICDRCGLEWREVEADGGQIGGSVTAEFMALAESGEAELVYCSCGYAADAEAGATLARPTVYEVDAMEKIATPGVHTIAELAEFLNIPESSTVKALSGKDAEGNLVCVFIPGDHELNELKVEGVVPGFTLLTDEEMVNFGLCKGSMGPVGLPECARVIASLSLKAVPQWVVGANEDGYHYVGARLGEDFTVDEWADLATVKPGDCCPECGLPLEGARGIEVAQVFQLGTKYSQAMGATFMDEEGNEVPFFMGCYGVGISRTMAAIVEQHYDEHGIMWPPSVAPAQICVIPLTVGDEEVQPMAEKIARDLDEIGFEVVIDDRDDRAGVKFNDADLIGWPVQVVVGKRGLAENKVEVKLRRTGEKKDVSLDVLAELMGFARRAMRNNTHSGAGYGSFDALFG